MIDRLDPLERDIAVLIDQDLSPAAQSATLAAFARETLVEAEALDEAALGHAVAHQTFVDGREGAPEESVTPTGTIVYEFDLIEEVFAWIDDQLIRHSPQGSGRDPHPGLYARSHVFYADDAESDPLAPPPTIRVGTFVNSLPYARKIESGESPQFPDGVYEVVTALAARRFGNIARIQFAWRTAAEGSVVTGLKGNKSAGRNPAIIVTVK